MSPLCWFLLFSVAVVHGTDDVNCTADLGFIKPAHWPVLRNLGPWLGNAQFVNVRLYGTNTEDGEAVVHTRSRQTFLYGSPYYYGTDNSRVRELSEIRGRDIKDIQFGYHFMAVLDLDGILWTVGRNDYGQLSASTSRRTTLTRVNLPGRVKEIAVGSEHCVALTTDGQLFSWGNYFFPEASLGYIGSNGANPTPRSFTLGRGVSRPNKICCGHVGCAVLTQHSGVYSWGPPLNIGRTMAGDHRVPGQVEGIPPNEVIIKLSCGLQHTVAVSSTGHLYGWGRNFHSELLQTPQSYTMNATLLGIRVSDAVAGSSLTVVRNESGASVFFGLYNKTDYRIATPTTLDSPRDLLRTGSATNGAVRLCG